MVCTQYTTLPDEKRKISRPAAGRIDTAKVNTYASSKVSNRTASFHGVTSALRYFSKKFSDLPLNLCIRDNHAP